MMQTKQLTLTVLVALVSGISAYAYDVKIDGIYYDLRESWHYETDSETGQSIYVKDYFVYVTHDNNYVDVDPDPTNTRLELQGGHYSGNIVIPSSIVYNEITYQVVGVDSYAFYKCTELESVVLPDSVKSIGSSAFSDCSSLTSITLPESVMSIGNSAFSGCSSLTSITLPESLTSIESCVFWRCSSLTSITLPGSLTRIGYGAFYCCSSLEEIELPEGLRYIAEYLFWCCRSLKKVNIPSSVISFRSDAFSGCNSLNSITIPENSSISFENGAFRGYNGFVYNLSDMEIDSYSHVFTDKSGLDGYVFGKKDNQWYFTEYIGENGALILPDDFNGSHYEIYSNAKIKKTITTLDTGNGITDLPKGIFLNFSDLNEVTIGKNLQTAGAGVLAGCYNLRTLNYNAVRFENPMADNGVYYENENGYNEYTNYPLEFKSISTLNIGDEVEYIPSNMVQENKNLTTVNLADGIKAQTIGEYTFYGCRNLQSINLYEEPKEIVTEEEEDNNGEETNNEENGEEEGNEQTKEVLMTEGVCIKNIGSFAFYGCTGLKEINLEKVETIGSSAFYGCTGLTELTLEKNLSSIGVGAFAGCYNLQTLNYNVVHFENPMADKYVWYYDENGNEKATYFPLEFKSISTLNIGDDVEFLPKNAFQGNKKLTKVELPNIIKTINASDFSECTGLQEINLENVETIGSSAFKGCTGLIELTLGKNLTSIGVGSFAGCYNLQTLNYNIVHFENPRADNYVRYIDKDGYSYSTYTPLEFKSISTLNIGDEVEYIPNNMVQENKNLTTVNLADGIKAQTIGERTFYGCSNLQSINLYEEPKEIVTDEDEENSDEENNNEENGEEENEETKEVQMTKGVYIKNIGEYAFYGCPNLNSSLDLRWVETIGNYAFGGVGISNLTLGKKLSSIGNNAFSFNAPLEKLTVSNDYGLNYMLGTKYYDDTDYRYKKVIKKLVIAEDFADEQITGDFTNQNNLETIESNTVEPLAFALANPFTESQYSSIAVKVPEESAEKYKAAPVWKLFYVTSADCLLKLYNGSSEMQLIPQDGTERPQEATAVNAVMLIDEQLEAGNGLLAMGNVIYRNKQNNWVAGEINLSDAKPFYNPVDAVAQTINYVRNFTSTNLQALYLPYAMSYDDWKDKAKVSYINDVHQFDDDDDGEIDRTVLEFISVKSGELAPNIPYLIKPLEEGETTFTSSNKTLKATLYDGYIDCSSTRMLYTLKGTYQTRDDIYANGYYAMSGGTFKVADNAGVKLSPFRIFLSITNRYGNGAVPRAKKITIMVDGVEEETTDIDEIMMSDAQPTEIYNLQGVRVDEGYKGIVIRNGRKVLVK